MHAQVSSVLDTTRGVDVSSTVFVIDGDPFIRESLEILISTAGWQPRTFASPEEFLSQSHGPVPCCVLLDMTLPGISGLEVQKRLSTRPDMPIIFITSHRDVPMTVQAMKSGAFDVLTKPFEDDALLRVIRVALEHSQKALREASAVRRLRVSYSSLTPREREVMSLVVAGFLNKQVGGELGISEITVKAHRGNVMRKMNADSLPRLVTMAATLRVAAS
jgi:FixJ family two-component response regulator